MIRPIAFVTSLVALFAIASPAQAAPKSCQREGATLLAASGKSACRQRQGEGPELRDPPRAPLRLLDHDRPPLHALPAARLRPRPDRARHIEIVDGRYIGIIRDFEGGVSESQTAGDLGRSKHVAVRNSKPCDEVSSGDFSGVEDAVFFRNGGLAYSCNGSLRSPTATATASSSRRREGLQLAVAANARGFGARLYYTPTRR